jgi:hypothetical protein
MNEEVHVGLGRRRPAVPGVDELQQQVDAVAARLLRGPGVGAEVEVPRLDDQGDADLLAVARADRPDQRDQVVGRSHPVASELLRVLRVGLEDDAALQQRQDAGSAVGGGRRVGRQAERRAQTLVAALEGR